MVDKDYIKFKLNNAIEHHKSTIVFIERKIVELNKLIEKRKQYILVNEKKINDLEELK